MKSFAEFWPFYLSEHSHPLNRRLHFFGTLTVHILIAALIFTRLWQWLWLVPVAGYAFAWIGHFAVEKNRPATFKHPFYSLIADFKMFYLMLLRRL